jgi:hypothetical protein
MRGGALDQSKVNSPVIEIGDSPVVKIFVGGVDVVAMSPTLFRAAPQPTTQHLSKAPDPRTMLRIGVRIYVAFKMQTPVS